MQALATFTLYLLLFVFLGRFQEIFTFLAPLQLGKLSIALGLCVVLAKNAQDVKFFLHKSPIKTYILIMLVLALLGVPFSVYPGNALEKCLGFLRLLLTASLIVALSKDALPSMLLAITCVVLFISIQMLLSTSTGRVAVSSTYDPNDIALLCITFLPFAMALISHPQTLVKLIALAASGGAVASIALSGSRGGFISMLSVAIYATFVIKKRRMLLIMLMVVGAAIFVALAGDALWGRLQSLIDGTDYNLDAGAGRLEIWKSGLEIIIQRPLFGVGIGQFITGLGTLTGSPWKAAHNTFLEIGVDLGVGGFYAFCAILLFIFRLSLRGSQADSLNPQEKNIYLCLRLSLLGYCVGAFFLSQAYSSITYTLFCLAVVMYFHLERKDHILEQTMQEKQRTDFIKVNALQKRSSISPAPLQEKAVTDKVQLSEQQKMMLNATDAQRQLKKARLEAGDTLLQKNKKNT